MTRLNPMTDAELVSFLDYMIDDYAAEKVRAGNWPEDKALELSKAEFDQLLPNGVNSPDQYLFSIFDETKGQNVGAIWFAVRGEGGNKSAWIYDLLIHEQFRRQGYATQAMLTLEDEVKKLGLSTIGLHVFGHNPSAYALYQKIGYATTNIIMSKKVE
ncbi:MAG: GNAT family N-acetyltransferase [Chloroflexi bacterium]|nr:GNAT family N-acetyltransferase [Chloroflexota bacterium]